MATVEIYEKTMIWCHCSKCDHHWQLKGSYKGEEGDKRLSVNYCPRCKNPLKKRIIPEELRHLIKPTRKDTPIYSKKSQKQEQMS